MPTDSKIHADIEDLRARTSDTQELYREVCAILFFRYSITPTANKLYQYVRKGSMSAPAEALSKFWEDLREKSRVRIEHPDIPDDLRTSAGEFIATLWRKAQSCAEEDLSVFRGEAKSEILKAKTAQTAAEADLEAARRKSAEALALLVELREHVRTLQHQLTVEDTRRSALELQIKQNRQDIEHQQATLEDAQRNFAAELEKHRSRADLAEERFRAAEERALLEIDRERTLTTRLQKELNQSRAQASETTERYHVEMSALHTELGQVRRQAGMLEGNLQAALSERDRISADAESLRRQLTEATTSAAGYRSDVENWRHRAEDAQQIIAALQKKSIRRAKKKEENDSST